MPSPDYFPEGPTPKSQDDIMRVLHKWCGVLYDVKGNQPCSFPEGTRPMSSDGAARLLDKILIMLDS